MSLLSFSFIFVETKGNEGLMIKFIFEAFKVSGFWNKVIDLLSFSGFIYLSFIFIRNDRRTTFLILAAYFMLTIKIARHLIIYNDLYEYSGSNWIFNFKITFPIGLFLFFLILSLIQVNKLIRQKNRSIKG